MLLKPSPQKSAYVKLHQSCYRIKNVSTCERLKNSFEDSFRGENRKGGSETQRGVRRLTQVDLKKKGDLSG